MCGASSVAQFAARASPFKKEERFRVSASAAWPCAQRCYCCCFAYPSTEDSRTLLDEVTGQRADGTTGPTARGARLASWTRPLFVRLRFQSLSYRDGRERSKPGSTGPMSDLSTSTVASSAGWMVTGRGIQMVVSILANLALVRLLTPADFGHFAIVAADVGVVGSIVNFHLEDVLLRAPHEDLAPERVAMFGTALVLEVILISVGSVVVLGVFRLLDTAALVLVISSAANSWVSAQSALYERKFEYRHLSVIQTLGRVLAQLAAVGGAILGLGALVLYLRSLAQVVLVGLGLAILGELRWLPIRMLPRRARRLLWTRVRGFWGDGLLEQSFDRLVIIAAGFVAGQTVTGLFYEARFLARAPQTLLMPAAFRIRMNQLAHHTADSERVRIVLRSLVLTAIPLVGAALVAGWLADPLIPTLLGSGWRRTVPLFMAMLGLVPGLTLMDTIKAYFMAEGKMRPFIRIGRAGQYMGITVITAVSLWLGIDPARSLAFGLSAAYLIPVMLITGFLLLRLRHTQTAGS